MDYFKGKYETKPIKTIIISFIVYLLTILLIYMPTRVNAETCASSTNNLGYLNPSTNQWYSSTSNNISIPNGTTRLVIRTDNSNIKNNQISWSNTYAYKTYGRDNVNPTIEVRYGTSSTYQTIEDRCAKSISREYSTNCANQELLDCWTTTKITMSCNFTGDNSSANTLQIHINTNSPIIGHNNTNGNFYRSSTCLQISPNATDQIVNAIEESAISTNNSTQEAADEVVNAIENMSETIEDAIDDVKQEMEVNATQTDGVSTAQGNAINGYISRENGLDGWINNNDNNIVLSYDPDTTSFIWGTITRFTTAIPVIMTIIVTALSIGYIKLVIGR